MAAVNPDPSWQDLKGILERSFLADPSVLRKDEASFSPIEDMLGRSQALDLGRQYLPARSGDTAAVRWLQQQLPANENPESFTEKLKRAIGNVPLGGFSEQELGIRQQVRDTDPVARRYSVQRGEVPTPGGGTAEVGESFRTAAAQNLGVGLADAATDGARNIWWFLNAPQALASLATLQALHKSGQDFIDPTTEGQFLRNRGLRLAAAVPAMVGMSMAVGNFGRQAGYTAAVPSEIDKTQTADPLAEAGARYFLGRTGSLLSYDEFVKERPDVSKGEYEAYKAYLHGSALPLKATLDGINGPEVTFMGKSIPLLTGVLPAVAAVAGTAYGVRKAGRVLSAVSPKLGQSPLAAEAKLRSEALEASRMAGDERDYSERNIDGQERLLRDNLIKQAEAVPSSVIRGGKKVELSRFERQSRIDALPAVQAGNAYFDQRDANQLEILKQALLYSSLGLGGTAIAGQTAELIRRSLKGDAAEPEEPVVAVAPAPASPVKPQGQPRS